MARMSEALLPHTLCVPVSPSARGSSVLVLAHSCLALLPRSVLRTRYADDAAARMVANALSVDPEVCDSQAPPFSKKLLSSSTAAVVRPLVRLLTPLSLCRAPAHPRPCPEDAHRRGRHPGGVRAPLLPAPAKPHTDSDPPPPTARSAFAAADLRTLRAALSAFLDLLALCSRTLETFPSL